MHHKVAKLIGVIAVDPLQIAANISAWFALCPCHRSVFSSSSLNLIIFLTSFGFVSSRIDVNRLKRTRDGIYYNPKWKIPPFNTSWARTTPIRLAQIFFVVRKLQSQLKSNFDFVFENIFHFSCYACLHPMSLPLKLFITVLILLKFNSKLFAIALKLTLAAFAAFDFIFPKLNQNGMVDTAKLITTRTGYSFKQMYLINISGREFQGCK